MEKIYFVTNRNPNRKKNPDRFGNDFNNDGFASVRYGYADVTGKKFNKISLKVADEKLVLSKKKVSLDDKSVLGSKELLTHLQKEMVHKSKDTLVFVHGYNVTFKESIKAAAKLSSKFKDHSDGVDLNIVVFAWPSDGSCMPYLAYANDRQDAAPSGVALARAFLTSSSTSLRSNLNDGCR